MVREFNSLTELNVRNKKVLAREQIFVTLTHATVCVCVLMSPSACICRSLYVSVCALKRSRQ